ncbi:MAG TPA: valine--tRNA ligase [Thermomicrobiales bacterium]|nr:valine--tRNA ligase [Thermomicrobiales bacterium]
MAARQKSSNRARELGKAYEPAAAEQHWYQFWQSGGYFKPVDRGRGPFVIVMPPPNVTGELHMGHALFSAVEDILTRYKRMQGHAALWLPGADHAGIAGQWVVERELAREGKSRHDLGREEFVARIWDWMETYQERIKGQLRLLGASADWSRYVFTMDPGPARAVRVAFKHLYDKGLIYRGERIISWCPRCMTALSDLEVVHEDEQSFLWHLRYPLADGSGAVEVATTRPETMLGDTGVAVHPDDERYKDLVGKELILPIVGRRIPIVADAIVDPEFGSGAVKVTPAHDPNDFEIGRRAGLPAINIMNLDGTMNAEAGPFAGQTIAEARKNVVKRLEEDGALVRIEPHTHSVGHCDRCGSVVEPMISKQWFVSMEPLAKPAIEVVKDGTVRFIPDRFSSVYLNWMENIHDWCISRQLWWGHRIPIWYCDTCGEVTATDQEVLTACGHCGSDQIRQDPDVLDTWFSSGLWTFSTLGWPDQTPDLEYFYPGHVMETGYDIIFHWVARMIFFGIEFMGEAPFRDVYLHGTVRDADGQRMSKTKGNVLDPTLATAEYGSDALRFALITASGPGNDLKMSNERVESMRNFANKLFNATKFALRAIEGAEIERDADGAPLMPDADALAVADAWIIDRLHHTIAEVTRQVDEYQLHEAGRSLYEFIWSEFCDWYIEAAKVRLYADTPDPAVPQTLAYVLERTLRLLHPFMPFVTEELWQHLPHPGEALIVAPWPEAGQRFASEAEAFAAIAEAVRLIRNARAEQGVDTARRIPAIVYPGPATEAFDALRGELISLARLDADGLEYRAGEPEAQEGSVAIVSGVSSIFLPLKGMIDVEAERARITREIEQVEGEISRATAMLANEQFVSRAPANVVEGHRAKLAGAEERLALLQARLADLG